MTTEQFEEVGAWPGVLGVLSAKNDLPADVARAAMAQILAGEATSAQIAAFMVALRMKGETVEELGGLVAAMLDVAVAVPLDDPGATLDVVGTGGDRSHTINVSTIASFVVAGAGLKVCKHGNRAASSSCGAADVLEALGVVIDLDAQGVARCVAEAGMGFCFAPRFHAAFRHAGPPRRELGIATSFNVLGPMTNPGRVGRHLIGLADASMAERMLGVLAARGSQRALVVHGEDGLDEVSTTATSTVTELRAGEVSTWTIDPQALGMPLVTLRDLRGADAKANAKMARGILAGEKGPHRDIVVLNAAAAYLAGDAVESMAEGVLLAQEVLDDGRAEAVLERLVAVSNDMASNA